MSTQFNTIGIIGKHGDPNVGGTLAELIDYLHKQNRAVLLDEVSFDAMPDIDARTQRASRNEIGERCDMAIVLGGDGTLLNAARSLVDYELPILGINLGRLGFLVDISPADLADKLDRIFAGGYQEENRTLLHARVIRDEKQINESPAFNDVVIHTCNVARMIEYETYIGGQFVNSNRSDGILVATPTGSTAYALSGGGPILHPSLHALVLVPICPHTMSFRPIVVDADTRIEIVISERNQAQVQVTCDGQIDLGLINGDRVVIEKKAHLVRLIHPDNYNYYSILRAKLHWGKRL
jgi:NAD+ kinase